MEQGLGSRDYFAGPQFTACDVQLTFVLEAAAARGRLADCPKLTQYLARVQARPAYQRALERGGPYQLGGR